MIIWDLAKADAEVFFSTEDFAERVTWIDQDGIVADKSMSAIVDRRGPEFALLEETSDLTSEGVKVTVQNDADEGLTSIRTGDLFRLAVRFGDPEKNCKIVKVIDTSPASFTVEVEA